MNFVPLSQVVQINPRPPKGIEDLREISFIPMAAVSEDGGIAFQETRKFGEVKKGFTYFQRGDILLAKITPCFENGKSALTDDLEHPIGFGSTEFHVLRAISGQIDPHFLYYLVRSKKLLSLGQKSMKGAAGHKRVPAEFIENFEIPDWPLDDQIRIAHLLGKVEGLIAQRKQHLQQLDDLLESVFLEMFGDPARNEKGWSINPLASYMSEQPNNGLYKPRSYYGSGTKIIRIDSFYDGFVQNTERLKRVNITDAELLKFEARQFDILVNRVNSIEYLGKIGVVPAISEPMIYESNMMRFRLNHEAMLPVYLMHFWRSPYLKSQINSKAKKAVNQASINQQDVAGLLVPQPSIELQRQFVTVVEKVEGIKSRYQRSLNDLEALYGALSQQAFKGELDLSRVALPAAPAAAIEEEESPVAVTAAAPITTQVINLPETDLLLPVLNDRTQLAPLLRLWLEAYCTQLEGAAFSLEHFIDAAQTRLSELHPDYDFALGACDYEAIKAWIFDQIQNRKLKQTRDSIYIDGRRRFANQILLRARRHAQQ